MLKDFLKYALISMRQRRLRSWLTIIGIVIGVASIVALVAISQGMQNYIEDQFKRFGANIIIVRPGVIRGTLIPGEVGLTTDDVDIIDRISGVDYTVPILYQTAEVEYHHQETQADVMGYPVDRIKEFLEETDYGFIEGGVYGKEEDYAIVLGYLAAKELFDEELHVRNRILIEGHKFKVVGILEEIGNERDDMMIAMPLETARNIFNKSDEVNIIMVVAKDGVDVNKLRDEIEEELEDARGEKDFTAISAVQLVEKIGNILGVIELIVGAIASISLFVGAVGIMNTMYTSVLERTREIGVMKAIGATNANIMSIFLIESGLLGLVGGLIGVIIGSGIALAVGYVSPNLGLPFTLLIRIEWNLIIFGIAFAFILGTLAGFLPARSAAKLKPAEALRYE